MPITAATSSATNRGALPSHQRNDRCTSWVFCAMNTTRSSSSAAAATTATHAPLVRERRSGSFCSVVVSAVGCRSVMQERYPDRDGSVRDGRGLAGLQQRGDGDDDRYLAVAGVA